MPAITDQCFQLVRRQKCFLLWIVSLRDVPKAAVMIINTKGGLVQCVVFSLVTEASGDRQLWTQTLTVSTFL